MKHIVQFVRNIFEHCGSDFAPLTNDTQHWSILIFLRLNESANVFVQKIDAEKIAAASIILPCPHVTFFGYPCLDRPSKGGGGEEEWRLLRREKIVSQTTCFDKDWGLQ